MKTLSQLTSMFDIAALAQGVKRAVFVSLVVSLVAACASNSGKDDTTFDDQTDFDNDASAAEVSPIDDSVPVEIQEPVIELETVFYFDYDESTLTSAARAALDAQAAALRANSRDVRLEGHADERGSREYNLALGERRAKAVADYLAIQGISRARIEVVSYGEERPVSLRSDESAYRMNRRVELK